MLYKDDANSYSKLKSVDKLSAEVKKLMIVYHENLYHAQKLQKQAYNKGVKPKSYTLGNKVWFNSKYIKTKQNRNLKVKFFRPF